MLELDSARPNRYLAGKHEETNNNKFCQPKYWRILGNSGGSSERLEDVALNQRLLTIETRTRSLVQRLEMSVKYSSAPVFRNVHRTEILTL